MEFFLLVFFLSFLYKTGKGDETVKINNTVVEFGHNLKIVNKSVFYAQTYEQTY